MSRPPLWKVVDGAWWSLVDSENPHCDPPAGDQAACVIRAVAEWVEKCQVEDYGCVLSDVHDVIEWFRSEADRAERGGGEEMSDAEKLWLSLRNHPQLLCLHPTPKQLAILLEELAAKVEERGDSETADWLRLEAAAAREVKYG